ncbi:MAG: dTDP-4-dehydrorhamnose reductase [Clostridium sp.]|nr:dTDP-4-dehydrorhamnose reductase [Prevotella sp.]MCM1429663.1 dTDP-4-dehydrorhamnose reductase [Clostridium sp.]MCM1474665.1 dTDP-4-dehydrorhamnose reductase [Muribaculaceae bacterium]
MKKILITGSHGQLGESLRRELSGDTELSANFTDVEELDITDRESVERYISDKDIDIIVNCAAYTAVDRAEQDDLTAARINTEAVGYIAESARKHGVKVIHISTDYVFSGESCRPIAENDEPYPHSIYGRTKLEGEGLLTAFCPDSIIIRTAWLYSEYGTNFVKTMLRLAGEKKSLNIVSDQIGTPTYAGDLASAIHTILRGDWTPGIYHFTNEGVASWYDFAMAIFRIRGIDVKVTPVSTREYPTPAKRPLYSVLSKNKIKKTYNLQIPYWETSLRKCLNSMK